MCTSSELDDHQQLTQVMPMYIDHMLRLGRSHGTLNLAGNTNISDKHRTQMQNVAHRKQKENHSEKI